MLYSSHATLTTRLLPADTNSVSVYGGIPVRVYGFAIANHSLGVITYTITTNETSPTTLFSGTVDILGEFECNIPFIADKGLKVISSLADNVEFVFMHTQSGS